MIEGSSTDKLVARSSPLDDRRLHAVAWMQLIDYAKTQMNSSSPQFVPSSVLAQGGGELSASRRASWWLLLLSLLLLLLSLKIIIIIINFSKRTNIETHTLTREHSDLIETHSNSNSNSTSLCYHQSHTQTHTHTNGHTSFIVIIIKNWLISASKCERKRGFWLNLMFLFFFVRTNNRHSSSDFTINSRWSIGIDD